jgi:hypothetical protein
MTGYSGPGGYTQTQQPQQSHLGNGGNGSNTYVSNFNNYLVHQQQQQQQPPPIGSSNFSKGNNIPRPSSCLEKEHPTNNTYLNLQSQQPQQQQINK